MQNTNLLLSSVETFDVAGNEKIVGTIPTEIGMVTNLRVLDAGSSQTSGTIPTEIGKLESLEVFKVLLARLKGSLPSELGQLSLLGQCVCIRCSVLFVAINSLVAYQL